MIPHKFLHQYRVWLLLQIELFYEQSPTQIISNLLIEYMYMYCTCTCQLYYTVYLSIVPVSFLKDQRALQLIQASHLSTKATQSFKSHPSLFDYHYPISNGEQLLLQIYILLNTYLPPIVGGAIILGNVLAYGSKWCPEWEVSFIPSLEIQSTTVKSHTVQQRDY